MTPGAYGSTSSRAGPGATSRFVAESFLGGCYGIFDRRTIDPGTLHQAYYSARTWKAKIGHSFLDMAVFTSVLRDVELQHIYIQVAPIVPLHLRSDYLSKQRQSVNTKADRFSSQLRTPRNNHVDLHVHRRWRRGPGVFRLRTR